MSHRRKAERRRYLRGFLEVLGLFGLMALALAFFGLVLFCLIWVALEMMK